MIVRTICSSHRSRGAWIEIDVGFHEKLFAPSHRSRGAWIEIIPSVFSVNLISCRIAHAVRGLKCNDQEIFDNPADVASLTRCVDWNKIINLPLLIVDTSHRSRGAWIEIKVTTSSLRFSASHRSRGAWIEISVAVATTTFPSVASLTRCVDWNALVEVSYSSRIGRIAHAVRGLKSLCVKVEPEFRASHRSRGAWIEI